MREGGRVSTHGHSMVIACRCPNQVLPAFNRIIPIKLQCQASDHGMPEDYLPSDSQQKDNLTEKETPTKLQTTHAPRA